jgi:hypothetical protein
MNYGRGLNGEDSRLTQIELLLREPNESSRIALPVDELAPKRPGDLAHPIYDLIQEFGELFRARDTAPHHPVGQLGKANNLGTKNRG